MQVSAPRRNQERVREAAERFRRFLARKRLRMTQERQAIIEEIFSSDDHFDVETLHARLTRGRPQVSRATIYRTLDLLVESAMVERVRFASDTFQYEPRLGSDHHDHMVCTRCGLVIEFVSAEIERLQHEACAAHGFRIASHRHVILGLCRDCQEGEQR
jgi:Fur family ferric uptake transcriptional regulator